MNQLNNDGGGDELSPYKSSMNGREVIMASAGGQHIVALVKRRE